MSGATTGAARLTQSGVLHFGGADAQTFLQGQLSCDVNGIAADGATYGSYNTPKGRMLATFLLWRDESGFVMQLPRSLSETLRKRLSMYVLRSKVVVRDLSDEYELFGVAGKSALDALGTSFPPVPSAPLRTASASGMQFVRIANDRCLAIFGKANAQARAALGTLPQRTEAEWDLAEIRAGIPHLSAPTQEQFVPQMGNLDLIGGVSFNKGCYPGQEIVARMHYLGRLKQRMYLARIDAAETAQPGDKLFSPDTGEQATGMIVNAAPDPAGGQLALAVMHIDSFAGNQVHWKSLEGPQLSFLELPYGIPP